MSQNMIPQAALTYALRPAAQAALLVCMSAGAWAQSPAATPVVLPAATLEFVQGSVAVRTAAGASRIAQRGTVINNGETIETQSGRAQMRMIDGAFISLQNDTTLRLDNYRMASASEAESGLMSLVRGGLRTVTGLIGRSTKQNYRLQTSTATIGIRGTGFSATSGDDGTRVRVAEGAIALCTQGGCLDLAAQQSGFANSANTLPVRIATAPALQPTAAPSIVVAVAQQGARDIEVAKLVEEQRPPVLTPPEVPSSTPLTAMANRVGAAYSSSSTNFAAGVLDGSLRFDSAGRLLEFVHGALPIGYRTTAASVTDFGSDGIVAWGRWSGGDTTDGVNATGGINYFTYIAGNTGSAVPIVGTYNVFGSTAPVAIDIGAGGATAVGTSASSDLQKLGVVVAGGVSAIGTSNSVTGNMQINFPGASGGSLTYNLAIPLSGQTFNLSGSAMQAAGLGFVGTTSTISSTGGACTNGCTSYANAIQGGIFGTGNTRVGAQYGFNSGIGLVTGAVVLRLSASSTGSN